VDHDEEVASLNALVRESHECIKDLNAAMKNAEKMIERIENAAAQKVDEVVQPIIAEFLKHYADTMMQAIKEGEEAVYERFNDIANILLGETRSQQGKRMSLVEQAEALRRIRAEKDRLI
jgi:N-methylhydantoinase B/oxoprolinase/acetone carboxylase alpha subunit